MAIVGGVLALGTQIWEWKSSIEQDRAARQQNKKLLEALGSDAHEIRRAVTLFQTISFDWSVSFDGTNGLIGPYIQDLAKLVEAATSKPWPSGVDQSDEGLRRAAWNPKSGEILAFRIDADSPAMPDEGK
jgi:hypothetical protein